MVFVLILLLIIKICSMKIALCLHGQPRNYEAGFQYINNHIIKKYDTDVFIHTWWDDSLIGQNYNVNKQTVGNTYKIEENLNQKLTSLYNPKEIILETPIVFKPSKIYPVSDPNHHDSIYDALLSRSYSMYKSVNLRNKYLDLYDFTIIVRFDLRINQFPNLHNLQKDNIYVSDGHPGRPYIFYDFVFITGNHYKYIGDMYNHVLETFERQQTLSEENKRELHYEPEMINSAWKGFDFHHILAYYLLFGGLINKTHKLNDLNTFFIR